MNGLAVLSAQRPSLIDIPTAKEAIGVDVDLYSWFGLVAPKGTPQEIIDALNQVVTGALRDDGLKKSLEDAGVEIIGSGADEFREFIAEQHAEAMNLSSMVFPKEVSEAQWLDLKLKAAHKTRLGIIQDAPVALECKLIETIELERGGLIALGEVLAVHIKKEAVVDQGRGYVDASQLNIIGRWQSPGWYVHTDKLFKLEAVQRKVVDEQT